jgi:amidase/aspartyl-tRNA(Asn)/glutamyl-tRNA(Gln) amidotransferase subunit A
MSAELCFTPATELAARIRRRDVSPVELVEAFLSRIEDRNPDLNAYVLVLAEEAREMARGAEREVMQDADLPPLHGVPVAIKDLLDFQQGLPNTFGGCRPLVNYKPSVTSTHVERLQSAGAIIMGRCNAPEFGPRGLTDNLTFGPTSTPYAIGRNAGGSSGGSAAAVADGLAALAQGSDGGGSIRIPAAWCGAYGFKASAGRVASVARPDAFIMTPYIHNGPITRTVDDAALMLSVLAGPHPRDPLSLPDSGVDYLRATRRSIKRWRIGYSQNFGIFPVDPAVKAIIDEAVQAFAAAGAEVRTVNPQFNHTQQELCALWMRQIAVLNAQLFESLRINDGIDLIGDHRDELTPEVVELVEAGRGLSALEYKQDEWIRSMVFDTVQDLFEDHHIIVTPTLAIPPVENFDNGNTRGPQEINGEKVDPYLGWCLTYPINYTGHPAASIPAGLTPDGLPVGMQIIGRLFADEDVLAASAAYERVRPWAHTYPGLTDSR